MLYTPNTKKALSICFHAHKEQLDKSGLPYVFHPFHLAEQMHTEDEIVVALLHDVAEDTSLSFDDLKQQGFSDTVIEALTLLTHDKNVNYQDYIAAIKTNPLATAVKIADLTHNADTTRLDVVDDTALQRKEKYLEALAFLQK